VKSFSVRVWRPGFFSSSPPMSCPLLPSGFFDPTADFFPSPLTQAFLFLPCTKLIFTSAAGSFRRWPLQGVCPFYQFGALTRRGLSPIRLSPWEVLRRLFPPLSKTQVPPSPICRRSPLPLTSFLLLIFLVPPSSRHKPDHYTPLFLSGVSAPGCKKRTGERTR